MMGSASLNCMYHTWARLSAPRLLAHPGQTYRGRVTYSLSLHLLRRLSMNLRAVVQYIKKNIFFGGIRTRDNGGNIDF